MCSARFLLFLLSVIVAVTSVLIAVGIQQALEVPSPAPTSLLQSLGIRHIVLQDGRIMEYHVSGDPSGTPALCIQGTLQTGRSVCKLVDEEFKNHGLKAVCPTLPGYGYSSWTDEPVINYPQDVKQLADKLGIQKFKGVAGWSGGGPVAAAIASELPDLAGNVLLLAVAAPPDREWYDYSTAGKAFLWLAANTRINELLTHFVVLPMLKSNCTSFFNMAGTEEELAKMTAISSVADICADMVRSVSDHCARGYTSTAQKMFGKIPLDWENIHHEGKRKTSIVYAEKDTLITPQSAFKYHENITGSQLYCFKGEGHGVVGLDVVQYLGVFWDEKPTSASIVSGKC
jgi:pimeloyl-ACP methyl ester carboxylesterase